MADRRLSIKYNFIPMQPKRMSLTLHSKSAIRQQMDQFLEADYQMLSQHRQEGQAVLHTHLARNNHIIHQYIQLVEDDYNVPNPLTTNPSKVSSNKKLELSILSASKEHFDPANHDKNKKKLTLTAKKRSNQSSALQINQNSRENAVIMTPKFFYWEQESDKAQSNDAVFDNSGSKHSKDPPNSLNRIASKEKPINFGGQYNHSTAKKGVTVEESQVSHHNFESRVTIKKIESPSLNKQDTIDSNEFIHKNPIISKMNKKNLQEYCRPGRIASSIIQQPAKKLKIKEAYRYCIGCELPVLQNNIRSHEKECTSFQYISALPSNLDVLKVVRQKIAEIQSRIPARNLEIEQQHVQEIRNKSASLVRESRKREECSPESGSFRRDYDSIMEIGRKWCSSIEEINKLRWFTRIAQKLEAIASQQQ